MIILAPNNVDSVGIFDLAIQAVPCFYLVSSAPLSDDGKFFGAVPAANGRTTFAPFNADSVGIFDPADDSFQFVEISAQLSNDWKFRGAAPTANDKIIFAPFHADSVGIFDPAVDSFQLVDISARTQGAQSARVSRGMRERTDALERLCQVRRTSTTGL